MWSCRILPAPLPTREEDWGTLCSWLSWKFKWQKGHCEKYMSLIINVYCGNTVHVYSVAVSFSAPSGKKFRAILDWSDLCQNAYLWKFSGAGIWPRKGCFVRHPLYFHSKVNSAENESELLLHYMQQCKFIHAVNATIIFFRYNGINTPEGKKYCRPLRAILTTLFAKDRQLHHRMYFSSLQALK